MNETESKIEDALELIVGHCYVLVRGKAKDSLSYGYGAAVDLFSGGCLFVPGIIDPRVITRVSQFMAVSRDCIAAWTAKVPDNCISDDNVTIHLQWRDKFAEITVPLTTQYLKIPLPTIRWEVCRGHNLQVDDVKRLPNAAPMKYRDAEKVVRDHLKIESHISRSTVGHGDRSHGCFKDRENGDMYIDEFLSGSLQPPRDAIAIRERLMTFSCGRRAVTLGIGKYSNGVLCEMQIWRKKMSVSDSVLSWCRRNRFLAS